MCNECIAHCDFCGFERYMGWERCDGWIAAYTENVKYTHVFSNPPMPDPNLCPEKSKLVRLAIRPGSCPRGPTKAYLSLYVGDEAEYEATGKKEKAFGTRGSGNDGCVGYEVRAELKGLGIPEWDHQWSHRNVRDRMGLDELSFVAAQARQKTPSQPTLNISPQTRPATAALPMRPMQGHTSPMPSSLAPAAIPGRMMIKWTDKLKQPPDEESSGADAKSDDSWEEVTSQPLPRVKSPRLQPKGKGRVMCEALPDLEQEEEKAPRRFVHEIAGQSFENVLDRRRDKKTGAVRLVIPQLPTVPNFAQENTDRLAKPFQKTAPAAQTEHKQEQARPQVLRRQTTHDHVTGNRRRVQFANACVAADERRRDARVEALAEEELDVGSAAIPTTRVRRDRQFNGPMMMPH